MAISEGCNPSSGNSIDKYPISAIICPSLRDLSPPARRAFCFLGAEPGEQRASTRTAGLEHLGTRSGPASRPPPTPTRPRRLSRRSTTGTTTVRSTRSERSTPTRWTGSGSRCATWIGSTTGSRAASGTRSRPTSATAGLLCRRISRRGSKARPKRPSTRTKARLEGAPYPRRTRMPRARRRS